MRFDRESHKIELRKRNFPQIDEKEKKTNSKKTAKVWPGKAYPVGMEAVTSRMTRLYKEKNENYLCKGKMEKEARSGEKISGPQPLNNSGLSFVSTPKGEK